MGDEIIRQESENNGYFQGKERLGLGQRIEKLGMVDKVFFLDLGDDYKGTTLLGDEIFLVSLICSTWILFLFHDLVLGYLPNSSISHIGLYDGLYS